MIKKKFMQTLSPLFYAKLKKIAKAKGTTLQELIRAEIVPTWIRQNNGTEGTIDIDKLIDLIERYPLNGKRKAKAVTRASKRW